MSDRVFGRRLYHEVQIYEESASCNGEVQFDRVLNKVAGKFDNHACSVIRIEKRKECLLFMKNFQNYMPEKYMSPDYQQVEEGIYLTAKPKNYIFGFPNESMEHYVTSLSFEMEPLCFGEEDGSPRNITQVPFEGLLDEFSVYISDFYDQLNEESNTLCFQEFASSDIEDIRNLRSIIGKRVYAQEILDAEEDEEDWELVIE